MKITVITATWNSEETIGDTLRSLAAQDYLDTEYLVIDGGSKDKTLDIIRSDGERVSHVVSEKDAGIYDALNKGIALATGDVIGFLHSDDIFAHPKVLSKIACAFQNHDIDAVYGDLDYVDKINPSKIIRQWRSGSFSTDKLSRGWMPPHPTFYMKRSCYEKMGGFDLNYPIAADYDSVLRYLGKHEVKPYYIKDVLVKMRTGGASNNSILNMVRKFDENRRIMAANGYPAYLGTILKMTGKLSQFFTKGS